MGALIGVRNEGSSMLLFTMDLAVHNEKLLSYISFWMDNVTVEEQIRVFSNQKP